MDLSTLMPQQRDIVTTLDRKLFVSAGAGSGKTFTLTRRILWALSPESGPFVDGLDQVLAITFTKDAAAEIRERVRAALAAEGMERAALSVDDAWISTIHGMCSRILRAHALELGIDPEFSVLEDPGDLMDLAVERVLSREGSAYGDLFGWYPLAGESAPGGFGGGTSVTSLLRVLLEKASAARNGFSDLRMLQGSVNLDGLADAYRGCMGITAGAAKAAEAALAAIEAFEAGEKTVGNLIACMMACKPPRSSKNLPKEQVNLLKAEQADAFVNAYLALGSRATQQLLEIAHAVFDEYNQLKFDRSVLDNNDLLRLTYQALRDNPAMREDYGSRFKMVMIDEFQDTDQQQVDLINFLTGEGGRALCTVGDAQQSIYRFRGAEVDVFRRAQAQVEAAAACGSDAGRVVQLVKNFRSHAEILDYVAAIFDGTPQGRGGLMQGFLNLQAHDGRKDGMVATGVNRRQALLVAGGSTQERAQARAQAIARRFRELADAGQPVGGMVLLLGGMPRANMYADAFRAQGLDCVISGGSVFAQTQEAAAVRALVWTLANLADTAQGLAPLLACDMFSLGAQEFLALATAKDEQTGETRRRNIDAGLMSDEDADGLRDLPLVDRARAVLRPALSRVGRDPLAAIARDVVNQSGWMVRLAGQGAEGRARAANVLKALDAIAEAEAQLGSAPRQVALAYDRFLEGKQAPGALNEEGGNAVRIMTVHASKGLEFPVVAVAECFSIKSGNAKLQSLRGDDGSVSLVALPGQFPSARSADGAYIKGDDVAKEFKKYLGGSSAWLTSEYADDVCASDSAAGAWLAMSERETRLELQERERLLYVAMTRAREYCLLAMDAPVRSVNKQPVLDLRDDTDLTGRVLEQILPAGAALNGGMLCFEDSRRGDFELLALQDFACGDAVYTQNYSVEDGYFIGEDAAAADADAAAGTAAVVAAGAAAAGEPACDPMADDGGAPDTFTLVAPAACPWRASAAPRAPRESYSYSSIAKELHGEDEDRAMPAPSIDAPEDADGFEVFEPLAVTETDGRDAGEQSSAEAAGAVISRDGDPTALGSAFHAACQWMVEMGEDRVPAARRDALARYWGCTPAQRERLDAALERWCSSAIRAEALAWPQVRAEVPFFSLGADDLTERFGEFAEGAIDLLCTDPDDPARALVIDYKTGGSSQETPEQLQDKHALQAHVYADVLHKAGFERVDLAFVRVEVEDSAAPGQPQVVSYQM
ncbi:UvrD-helicase domain-containing protein [Collinsella tanakaei]|uniref:UvrD-helicase domain-containing protein n=1 Tax=Collinsella tanakaei TaxID=626935 RepID=UPI0029438EE4|nr:UvrD-helicase domain-containing protein [Collinsella tanakaei]